MLAYLFLIRMLLSRSFTFEGRFVCNGPLSYVEFTNKTPEVALNDKIQLQKFVLTKKLSTIRFC